MEILFLCWTKSDSYKIHVDSRETINYEFVLKILIHTHVPTCKKHKWLWREFKCCLKAKKKPRLIFLVTFVNFFQFSPLPHKIKKSWTCLILEYAIDKIVFMNQCHLLISDHAAWDSSYFLKFLLVAHHIAWIMVKGVAPLYRCMKNNHSQCA